MDVRARPTWRTVRCGFDARVPLGAVDIGDHRRSHTSPGALVLHQACMPRGAGELLVEWGVNRCSRAVGVAGASVSRLVITVLTMARARHRGRGDGRRSRHHAREARGVSRRPAHRHAAPTEPTADRVSERGHRGAGRREHAVPNQREAARPPVRRATGSTYRTRVVSARPVGGHPTRTGGDRTRAPSDRPIYRTWRGTGGPVCGPAHRRASSQPVSLPAGRSAPPRGGRAPSARRRR